MTKVVRLKGRNAREIRKLANRLYPKLVVDDIKDDFLRQYTVILREKKRRKK